MNETLEMTKEELMEYIRTMDKDTVLTIVIDREVKDNGKQE